LTKEQVNALRSMMEDKRAAQAALSQGNQDIRVFENVSRKFDKPQQELADFYQAHDNLKAAVAAGDVASIQSALASYARMTGEKGPLSDTDISRTITPTFALSFAKLRSKITSEPNTPVPEETLKTLMSGIDRLKKAAEDKTAERINAAERQTSVGPGLYKQYSKELASKAREIIRKSEPTQSSKILTPEEFMKTRAKK
ncbi:MAG: hypothetical protein EBU90_27065, partial [Proteobacteria bacterium]|nr:hypothetical protein [Pseudomonadota bacterium]NBP16428.1 hypothetical protein [bacterium]